MGQWYDDYFVETGRSPALFLLLAFIVTYVVTRTITVRIHARQAEQTAENRTDDAVVKDVFIGGVHIHHQVWGILLVLIAGLLEFRFRPDAPWVELLAALFGVGAALALDEFALWLHVKDVYWTEEGKKSIDAVLLASVVCLGLLISTSPVGVNSEDQAAGAFWLTGFLVGHFCFVLVALLKGKLVTGLVGLPIPIFATVGALRLAKPSSFWARRFYRGKREKKMVSSSKRFGERYRARLERLRGRLSGMSSIH